MSVNANDIEAIVRQVLSTMDGKGTASPAPYVSGGNGGGYDIPKTAHCAFLTDLKHFEIKEFPMPEEGGRNRYLRNGCS